MTLACLQATLLLGACGGSSGDSSAPTQASPSISNPITDANTKYLLLSEVTSLNSLAVDAIRPHRTAESSYGVIPKDAPRLKGKTVNINGNWSGMLATGMYAAPGDVVEITVPPQLVNQGYYIRLSGHVDDIRDNREWLRMPYGIQRSFAITQATTRVATPYGGAIYIDTLDGADSKTMRKLGDVPIVISGAIEAPYFVLGKTSNADWVNKIRQNPAPYAEFVTDHVALSVPSSMIRLLADPEALAKYWDDYVAFQDWVGGTEAYRTGPDRINFDVQISMGYLHSGYPIQGPYNVEASRNLLNLDVLRKEGEWGYFHEMGHEMQMQPHLWGGYCEDNGFTFKDNVEVTVNIFAKAAADKMSPFSSPNAGSGYGWAPYAGQVLKRAVTAVQDSSKSTFNQKDQYPFYFSLADGFGWDIYRKVLSSYVEDARANSPAFPRKDQDKKDQWLIRWSKLSGYNMVEYMVNRWKLEVTPAAIATVNAMGLPTWLPATSSIDNFRLAANTTRQLDLKNSGFNLSGKAEFVRVTPGSNHTLTLNADGTYTFTPKPGALGRDQIKVVYKSEAGNEVETRIQVEILPAQ
ncbi:M60 family metallopeptidase [Burkholderiaceae bacterium DAT-1]|nr:M60 family metallopeptidase [Burkholderiaceae bacterium DAT-1]